MSLEKYVLSLMIVKHLDSPPLVGTLVDCWSWSWVSHPRFNYIWLENCPTYQDSPRINFKILKKFALQFKFALNKAHGCATRKNIRTYATFNSTHRSAIKYPNKIMCTERELWIMIKIRYMAELLSCVKMTENPFNNRKARRICWD